MNQKIIADAHIHIHKCFEIDQLLNASLTNFQKISRTKTDINNSFFYIFNRNARRF
ncbi:MAG: hypothetical protein AAGJ08_15605 [Cyanobacteria bacterium P01_H01_bin.35]